jgi:hypothetical protein
MKPALTSLLAFFLPSAWGLAPAQQAAQTLELNEKNYSEIRQALTSPKDESGWREIPWRPNLGEAIIEARKENKPILLWIMNGHPCGMT